MRKTFSACGDSPLRRLVVPVAVSTLLCLLAPLSALRASAADTPANSSHDPAITVYPDLQDPIAAAITKDGLVRLSLSAGNATAPIEIRLQPFFDPDGNPVTVSFLKNDEPASSLSLKSGGRTPLVLRVTGAQPGTSYSGEIWIIGENELPVPVTVSLTRTAPQHYYRLPSNGLEPVEVDVPDTGKATVFLDVRYIRENASTAKISISEASEVGGSGVHGLYLVDDEIPAAELPEVSLGEDILPLAVDAGELEEDKAYLATIKVTGGGKSLTAFFQFTRHALTRTSVPWLEFPRDDLEVTCRFGRCKPQPIHLLLSEEQGRGLSGVFVSGVEPPAEPPEARNLRPGSLEVRFKGSDNLLNATIAPAPDDDRSIAPAGQREVVISFKDELRVGRYKTKLRFGAADADPTKFPEFIITATVRSHWIWAVLVLVLGVLGSFFVSKGVATMYRRAETLRLLAGLRRSYWLRLDKAGTPPIVRIRAEFMKMQDALLRAKPYQYLTRTRVIHERLEKVRVHLPYVERLSACIAHWQGNHSFEGLRARTALSKLSRKLQAIPFDEDPKSEIDTGLSKMEEWQNPALLPQHYQLHLMGAVESLLRDVDAGAFGESEIHDLETVYAKVLSCLPDTTPLTEALHLIELVQTQVPGTPHIPEIKAQLEAVSESHDDLLESINTLRRGRIGPPANLTKEANEIPLHEEFESACESIADALFSIRERLGLVSGLSGPAQDLFDRAKAAVDELQDIDMAAVETELAGFSSVRNTLALSPADVAGSLIDWVTREKEQISSLRDAVALEKRYAVLKLLWLNRDDGDLLDKLLKTYQEQPDPELLFRIVDMGCWSRLKNTLRLSEPSTLRDEEQIEDSGSPARKETAYRTITFEVSSDEPKLGGNFLFERGLRFEWNIDFGGKPLTPVTNEPSVTQFVPRACEAARVDVTVRYIDAEDEDEPVVLTRWFSVGDTDIFKPWDAFSGAELFGVALAATLAVVTGLNSEYLTPGLLGTLPDYIALFIWGFVADQARNILQNTVAQPNEAS
jgi:hypothetical protein